MWGLESGRRAILGEPDDQLDQRDHRFRDSYLSSAAIHIKYEVGMINRRIHLSVRVGRSSQIDKGPSCLVLYSSTVDGAEPVAFKALNNRDLLGRLDSVLRATPQKLRGMLSRH